MSASTHSEAHTRSTQASANSAESLTPEHRPSQFAIRNSWPLALVLLAYFVLGVAYSLVVPPFEAPDEPFHYAFVRHVAQGNGLPVQDEVATGPWAQEGSQAPLYYLVAGLLTAGVDARDFPALAVTNPRANIGDPLAPDNKNFMLYSGQPKPLQQTNLAVHIARWFSLLLGAATICFTYLTAQFVFPRRRDLPLIAAALVGAIPQVLFISAAVTNDPLVMATSAATVYWLARLLARPDSRPIRLWEWLVLGVLLGLAALSKLQGLGLIGLTGVTVLFMAWQRRTWRMLWVAAVAVGAPVLALAGWWYVRNLALYGDWSGLQHLTAINGRRQEPLTLARFWPEFRGLRYSFWGLFGWFNLLLPNWFYWITDALSVIAGVGVAAALARRWRSLASPRLADPALRVTLLLLAWAGAIALLLLYWSSQATGSQGRLLFPGMVSFAILFTLGLDFWLRWLPKLLRGLVWGGLFALLLGMSVYALGWLLPAAYYPAPPVTALADTATPLDLVFGDDEPIRLRGVEIPDGRYAPGARAPITLYLQADQPLAGDYQVFVQLLDEQGQILANETTHPGWGRNPTSGWQPGALYADRYELLVTGPVAAASPVMARVYVGFVDPATESGEKLPLPVHTNDGQPAEPFVGEVRIVPPDSATAAEHGLQPVDAQFGNVIRLAGWAAAPAVQASEMLTVTLLWEAMGAPATDYTAYVHLLDGAGQQVAGFDQPPAADRYPTRYWEAGDRILSTFVLPLPADQTAADYALWVGLYESGSGGSVRLPVTAAGDLVAGDGQVQLPFGASSSDAQGEE